MRVLIHLLLGLLLCYLYIGISSLYALFNTFVSHQYLYKRAPFSVYAQLVTIHMLKSTFQNMHPQHTVIQDIMYYMCLVTSFEWHVYVYSQMHVHITVSIVSLLPCNIYLLFAVHTTVFGKLVNIL